MEQFLDLKQKNVATRVANKLTLDDKLGFRVVEFAQGKGESLVDSSRPNAPHGDEASIQNLKAEMAAFQAQFKSSIAKLQTSSTELKLSIAELQTSDSEIKRSIAELQTSDSEIKRSNAELQTSDSEIKRSNAELQTSISEIKQSIAEVQASNSEIKQSIAEVQASNSEIKQSIAEPQASNSQVKLSMDELQTSNSEQKATIDELKKSHECLASTLERHGAILFAITCRMIIDDARVAIAQKYSFSLDQLRVGNMSRPEETSPLVQQLDALVDRVYLVLDMRDSTLLSKEALKMIFSPLQYSIRYHGDVAAHSARKQDLAHAVLGADPITAESVLLERIYEFAYGVGPVLEPL